MLLEVNSLSWLKGCQCRVECKSPFMSCMWHTLFTHPGVGVCSFLQHYNIVDLSWICDLGIIFCKVLSSHLFLMLRGSFFFPQGEIRCMSLLNCILVISDYFPNLLRLFWYLILSSNVLESIWSLSARVLLVWLLTIQERKGRVWTDGSKWRSYHGLMCSCSSAETW